MSNKLKDLLEQRESILKDLEKVYQDAGVNRAGHNDMGIALSCMIDHGTLIKKFQNVSVEILNLTIGI